MLEQFQAQRQKKEQAATDAGQRLPNKIIGLYGATPTKKAATNGPVTVPRPDGALSQLSTVQLKVEPQT